jgi:hypothetical protein
LEGSVQNGVRLYADNNHAFFEGTAIEDDEKEILGARA